MPVAPNTSRSRTLATFSGMGIMLRRLTRLKWLHCLIMAGFLFPLHAPSLFAAPPDYTLKPSDALTFSVQAHEGAKDFIVVIQGSIESDGMMDLGKYGRVKIAGMTVAEAKAIIDQRFTSSAITQQPFVATEELPEKKAVSAQRSTSSAPTHQTAHSINKKSEKPEQVLQPGNVLRWSVRTSDDPNEKPTSGQGVIQSDGALSLNQFGTVHVSGFTMDQAKIVIQQHVSDQLPNMKGKAPQMRVGTSQYEAIIQADFTAPSAGNADTLPPQLPEKSSQSSGPAQKAVGSEVPKGKIEKKVREESDRKAIKQPSQPVESQTLETQEHAGLPVHSAGASGAVPQELERVSLPSYVIDPPDILLIESTQSLRDQPIRGQHLVRPDGTISLGIYGSVRVAGLTLDQAREVIGNQIAARIKDLDVNNLYVDVLSYNSKVYYVITDGAGYGEQVYRFPITGSETVLDAVSQINGLPPVASKKDIWVARPTIGNASCPQILPVDWKALTQGGIADTNYQVLPGDRIYVKGDHWITFDSKVSKFLAPFERMVGFTLLTGETVNVIKNKNSGTGTGF